MVDSWWCYHTSLWECMLGATPVVETSPAMGQIKREAGDPHRGLQRLMRRWREAGEGDEVAMAISSVDNSLGEGGAKLGQKWVWWDVGEAGLPFIGLGGSGGERRWLAGIGFLSRRF
jgi:hypothetical protein